MGRVVVVSFCVLFSFATAYSQSHLSVGGGYNQSIFYCGQPKSTYYTSFTPRDGYLVNVSYKLEMPKKKNMRIGAMLEYKQQSAYFYYEQRREKDTVPSGMNYDISLLQVYIYPELVVGDKIKFILNGGVFVEYILFTDVEGIMLIEKERVERNEKRCSDIGGFGFGVKLSVGVEIPIYKGLYISLQNAYSAGLTSKAGTLKKQMKYYNCLDINLFGTITYRFSHKKNAEK